ncbi:MAG: 23S rRNA (uracil(1939)-C(5))-methyltransferase RlmD [Nitrospira sp.]|nr:23S rRNA (uracil(1939)-C(5))-methyltransferase RlmD [bacterium]MBL7049199.1 23S rRNA (uracil(1939)-C(5))-methyltransferase RlmD [Nitrospira sp.]
MELLKLKVDRAVYGGKYICNHEGGVIFIEGNTMPGEIIEARVEARKKDYTVASVNKILQPSAKRVEPSCKFYGTCGGCQIQHFRYTDQLLLKESVLKDCLKRIAKLDPLFLPVFKSDTPLHYRHKGQFKVSGKKAGFFKFNTHEIVDIDACPLMTDKINTFFAEIKTAVSDMNITDIHLTSGRDTGAFIKAPDISGRTPEMNKLAAKLMEIGLSGVTIETARRQYTTYGAAFVTHDLNGMQYTTSARGFLQSNWDLNCRTARLIKHTFGAEHKRRILDLYAGAGNFSFMLSGKHEITAVEKSALAVKDGQRNVKLNKIENFSFIKKDAERFIPETSYDTVILDPSRQGLSKKAMATVLALKPASMVYVSCNPSTFARDLKILSETHKIEYVRLIDFFPQTFHIESIAFLSLK